MSKEVRQSWRIWSGEIKDDTIDAIIKEIDSPTSVASVGEGNYNPEIRRSKVSWLKVPWILNKLYDYVNRANELSFNVNVYKQARMQYLRSNTDQLTFTFKFDMEMKSSTDHMLTRMCVQMYSVNVTIE